MRREPSSASRNAPTSSSLVRTFARRRRSSVDLVTHRIEDQEEHDRRHDRVQIEVARVGEHEQPEDPGERERERRQDEQAAGEIVEVEQALLEDRLREHEEEHEHQDGADRRHVEAEVGQVLGEREDGRDRAHHAEEGQARALEAGARAPAASEQQREDRAEQHHDVGREHDAEAERRIQRREDRDDHRRREPDRHAVELSRAARALGEERAEELHGRQRQQHGENEVDPLEHRRDGAAGEDPVLGEAVGEEPGQVPGADRRVEEHEEPLHAALARAECHARREREAEDAGEERGLGAQLHGEDRA